MICCAAMVACVLISVEKLEGFELEGGGEGKLPVYLLASDVWITITATSEINAVAIQGWAPALYRLLDRNFEAKITGRW